MPNNCLSVLYKRIIQVENKNVGLKVGGGGGGAQTYHCAPPPPIKKAGGGGAHAPLAPPLPTPVICIPWTLSYENIFNLYINSDRCHI